MISIQILDAVDIDEERWNNCVQAHDNGLVYSYTNYLNLMCDDWKAIIAGNYEALMPVPLRKKMGISYTYQVPFIQQLGIIGNNEHAQLLFNSGTDDLSYGDYVLNFKNQIQVEAGMSMKTCTNLLLPLIHGYSNIRKSYQPDLVHNLKKAAKSNPTYSNAEIAEAIDAFQTYYSNRSANYTAIAFEQFKSFCFSPGKQVEVICRKVIDSDQQLLAIALFLKDNKRIYNMMNTTTERGRVVAANHFLLDAVIQEYASSDLLFDFEGSDIPGIQHFYKNFGAVQQNYQAIHINKLPLPLRWLKQ